MMKILKNAVLLGLSWLLLAIGIAALFNLYRRYHKCFYPA